MFTQKRPNDNTKTYDDDMRPLSDAIQIAVTSQSPRFEIMVSKYQEDFLNKSAQSEFDTFLRIVLSEVQKMLSTTYTKNILGSYFTEYGQIMIIYDALKTLFMVRYNELSESYQGK